MKKIYNIILTTVVCLAGLAACTHDYPVGEMARIISLDPSTVQAAASGQTFDVTVTADGAWVADTPDWITLNPANGEGSQTVKVTVAENDGDERTDKVQFHSAVGDVSSTAIDLESTPLAELTVAQAAGEGQGGGDNTISIADYIALGPNTDTYIITGAITRVANTNYGNFDLTDETGTIYVYGLLNEELEAQKCWKEKELAMGDVLTVKVSEMKLYNGEPEIVNAVYISHSKSLIALEEDSVTLPKEGQDFSVKAEVKGADVKVDYDADWISYKGAEKDGENVTLNFTASPNAGMGRTAVMSISTTTAKGETSTVEFTANQEGNILTVSVVDFLAAEESETGIYELVGTVDGITNTTYGNFNLTDVSGTVYVYGLTATELGYGATNDKSFASLGLGEGDLIKIRGYRSSHNGNPQVKSAWFIEKLADGPKAVTVAEFLAAEESQTQVYILEGTIGGDINTTYGNFDLTDETGTVYVYGLTATELGYNAKNDKSFASLGLTEGDKVKIKGYRSSHNGKPQVKSAWFIEKLPGGQPGPITGPRYVKLTAAPENWSGEYLLVCDHNDINKAFSAFSTTTTVYGVGADVTVVSDAIPSDATTDACKLVIAPATATAGAYTIKFGESLLCWKSGNSLVGVAEESANSNWNITFETDHCVIRNAADAVRNLQWNASSPRFACYGNNNQTVIQLYRFVSGD